MKNVLKYSLLYHIEKGSWRDLPWPDKGHVCEPTANTTINVKIDDWKVQIWSNVIMTIEYFAHRLGEIIQGK